jgi:DUF1016 N-terminal domain
MMAKDKFPVRLRSKARSRGDLSLQGYGEIQAAIVALLHAARYAVARNVNALMTATYWEIGRRIVEFEQGGAKRAAYGEALVTQLSEDLTLRFGRGFSRQNLGQMRAFYRSWPIEAICQTPSGKSSAARCGAGAHAV